MKEADLSIGLFFCNGLEVESDFCCHCARRDIVRAAESGEEVVNRGFVRHVDGRETHAPLIAVAVEEIVVTDSRVKQIARANPGRIVIGILGVGRRHLQACGPVL